jgi:hypothetical protein
VDPRIPPATAPSTFSSSEALAGTAKKAREKNKTRYLNIKNLLVRSYLYITINLYKC